MPELPEVETIRRGLAPRVVNRTVTRVIRSAAPLRMPSPLPLPDMEGAIVKDITRHAKVLTWHLDDGRVLVSHLGMTGKWVFSQVGSPAPAHTHLDLTFDDGTRLIYADARRFGWLALHAPDDPPATTLHYGMDALDPSFTADHLGRLLSTSRAPLKAFLLDQTRIAGLGNIYACEALWRAGLSPRRRACNTPRAKVEPLRDAIVAVLRDSLAAGGTSFNDYVNSLGQKGSFLFDVGVFQRDGQPCPSCDAEVRRITQSGRSTFYCPGCQR